MRLIVFSHRNTAVAVAQQTTLQFALAGQPVAGIVLEGLRDNLCRDLRETGQLKSFARASADNVVFAVPESWDFCSGELPATVIRYTQEICIPGRLIQSARHHGWLIVSDGRFAAQANCELLASILSHADIDVLAVNATASLMAHCENVRFTTGGRVAGFRRSYADSAELAPTPADWPHHLFISARVLDRFLPGHVLPRTFADLVQTCQSNNLELRAVNIAGSALDLETEYGLLSFCTAQLSLASRRRPGCAAKVGGDYMPAVHKNRISPDVRFSGPVVLGGDISIEAQAVIVGPTIVADGANIGAGAVVDSSIIGAGAAVDPGQVVTQQVVPGPQFQRLFDDVSEQTDPHRVLDRPSRLVLLGQRETYRSWPFWSYPHCIKRIADIVMAAAVLILFAPVMPFIALAIKLNSPGPVFFKDKRQGLHGRSFNCIKFRTMTVGAHEIQDKLRVVSEVDGPQFKMADDPRISTVGRFLRETYIDEVPQFFNVLLGQMSTVGPRPSPESENTLCPWWRDARLSVRPGITGLWQVCRTRQPMNDFQEWIHYDTKYIRDLSLRLDLWICWQTAKRMVHDFLKQF